MAKHLVTWIIALINHNSAQNNITGTERMLDEMLMSFDCKHSDKSIPTHHFHSGISNLAKIPAKHMVPLIVQLQVVVGTTDVFFTDSQRSTIHDLLAYFVGLGADLHADTYTETDLQCLDQTIRRLITI